MLDITRRILSPKIRRAFCRVAVLSLMLPFKVWNFSALAHPGSGIAVDRHGGVYFTDTGQGVWKIDESGRVSPHEGPAFHWLAIDRTDRLAGTPWPAFLEPSTAQLPEGDDFPVGNVNFAEAELFCRKLSELSWQSGELPKDWEFRLPTEAQWEYACRAGTTTATAFGNKLSSRQANFSGTPYNGAEPGPSLHRVG